MAVPEAVATALSFVEEFGLEAWRLLGGVLRGGPCRKWAVGWWSGWMEFKKKNRPDGRFFVEFKVLKTLCKKCYLLEFFKKSGILISIGFTVGSGFTGF